MLGIIVNKKEVEEIKYMLKREMDEILFDLKDERIGQAMKKGMEERYHILFSLFKRVATPNECLIYIKNFRDENKSNKTNKLGVDFY